jgi:hypothetical protein
MNEPLHHAAGYTLLIVFALPTIAALALAYLCNRRADK